MKRFSHGRLTFQPSPRPLGITFDSPLPPLCAAAHKGGAKGGMYFIDMNRDPKITENARCITTRQDAHVSNHKGEISGVMIEDNGTYPCINPTKEHIWQGRRVREDGSPAFCITATDRHGIIHKGRIRRLLPQETWRLMGFKDEQFLTVQSVIKSDNKLYKLAGNSIIVPVVADLGRKLREVCEETHLLEE